MRVSFDEVFQIKNGMISPRMPVRIGGVTMTPGVSMGGGVSIGRLKLTDLVGKDLEVEKGNGVVIIKAVY